jgi:hypothetical protein
VRQLQIALAGLLFSRKQMVICERDHFVSILRRSICVFIPATTLAWGGAELLNDVPDLTPVTTNVMQITRA